MIKKEVLQQLVENELSQTEMAKECQCSKSQVVYWLKKYDLKTKYTTKNKTTPISKEKLEKLVDEGLTQKEIAVICQCSKDKVKYWLNKYNLKTQWTKNHKRKIFNIFCDICNKYVGENIKNRSFCMSCITKLRRTRVKIAAVKMLGGECKICGWDGDGDIANFAAFEFHHKKDENKDFAISNISNRGWDIVKKELDKCQLLCSRCHRVLHAERYNEEFMKYVYDYHGDQLDF
jgi:predicted transcriptional regulator